ncbi:unnamed protein product [Phytophthora fragariaefolia]|uniref:Radial spoke head protein 9 homolog n=1 Tax=Phytophthora fragariaefolia TaxID=1490495 RepID=A0A9W7DEK4_9STRA|nr:unnamed protein product [Phytophthora fragariaefolia]
MELQQLDVVRLPHRRRRAAGQGLPQEEILLLVGLRGLSDAFADSAELPCLVCSTNTSPELQQFPQLNKKKSAMAAAMTSRLKGDPAFLIGDAGEPQNQDEGEAPFCELDRLAHIVEEIDHATSVVPLGAYIVSPMHQVIANPSFHGLTWDQSMQLYNFFHFRQPDLPERAQIIESAEGLVRAGDFFDPLIQDLDGAWVISKDNTSSYITLRNYVYPGTFCFHQPLSANYGSVYFGDGRKNPDIAFMI